MPTASVSTVIELCDHLIGRAVEVGASDVHVECGNTGTLVRYRICGVLEPVLTLPAVGLAADPQPLQDHGEAPTSRCATARRTARSGSR